MSAHTTDDRMIDLAHGLLEPGEASACLAHLRRCGECEERFQAIAGEHARLVAEREPPVESRRAWIAVGASAAVLLVAAFLWRGAPRPDADPAPYWLSIAREETVQRAKTAASLPGDLDRALAAYEGRDARLAVRLLEDARVPPGHEGLRDLYLASALERTGETERAATVIERLVVDTLPEPWRTEARWVEYTIALRAGRTGRAAELLERLERVPGAIGDLARAERTRLDRQGAAR